MSKSRVFVGGISRNTRERDLERFFKNYGPIREILMKGSYAFVEFEDKHAADDAIYELDGKILLGQEVAVERARGIDRTVGRRDNRYNYERRNNRFGRLERTKYRVVVENLSSSVSWQDLKDFMRKAGDVTYGEAHRNRKHEGIVDFSSYSGMKRAIEELDDTELNGRRIIIKELKRSYNSSRARSRSPLRRSRSRSSSSSHSKSKKSTRSRSASRSKSRSRSRSEEMSKKRSRSTSSSTSRSRSRSEEQPKKHSRSRSTSRSRSRSGERPKKFSRSRSASRSKSRSAEKSKKRSRSISASSSTSRSPKRSKIHPNKSGSRSKSRVLRREKSYSSEKSE